MRGRSWWTELVGVLPFNFVVVCTPCAFFGRSAVSNVPLVCDSGVG